MTFRYVGQPRKRVEDRPLVMGAGHYVDDLRFPGTLHLFVVRSPYAHARITRLDMAPARRSSGVVEAVTGEDTRGLGELTANQLLPGMKIAPYPVLVRGVVRAVGEALAAVVAETPAQARDAAELIDVAYEPLPPLAAAPDAAAPGAPVLYPELGTNRAVGKQWRVGDPDAAF